MSARRDRATTKATLNGDDSRGRSRRSATQQVDGQLCAMEELYGDDFEPPAGTWDCVVGMGGWGLCIDQIIRGR
jgi:hypothetical protein